MSNYLIVGGSSGIGKAIAEKLSQEGHQVWATYHQHVQTGDSNLNYFPLNVLEDPLDLYFLPDILDGIAYCPGSINLLPFSRISPQAFMDDFQLQVNGAIKVIQKALPNLKAAEQSAIVLFSTVAVQMGFNFHTQVAVSKGAIEGLTRALAAEFAPGIRVNAIAPSLTNTPLSAKLLNNEKKMEANAERHPLKKIGTPENIADVASFLLSNRSSWTTGQILTVDGGISSIKN